MVVGHSSGHRVNPKYIKVHFPFKSDFVNSVPFAEKKVKSEITFGFSYKKSPFIKSSFELRTLGVVNLFIKRAKTVNIKITIKSTFFLTVMIKQLCNGLPIMPRRLEKYNI
tara:strand:- start:143 stop:475 length:333 start_codon:yes stop_codon:yes gene_type:complete